MYCEKCKKSFAETVDGMCPICAEPLVETSGQTQSNELLCAIEQLKQGNQHGFPVVYEYTYKYIYSRAKMLCNDPEDIADVVQEVYATLAQNIASLRSNESIFAWLRTITFHAGSRILKKKKHETLLTEENEEWLESLPDESADAESDFVNQEDIEIIRGCINRLPDELRAVVLAYYYDNLKIEEIAQLLSIPVGTVKSRLFVARKKIKQYIEEEECRLGYKLHAFSAAPLLMAIRSLLQKNMAGAETQKVAMYSRICSELSLSVGRDAATASTTIVDETSSATVAKTATKGIFKKATIVNVCKTVVAVVCGMAVVATTIFAGVRLVREHGGPVDNDVPVNQIAGTTVQTLGSGTSVSIPSTTIYTNTIVSTTTTLATTTNASTTIMNKGSDTSVTQTTTSTTSVVTKDYDPDPTHEPPQPGDVYETKDYIYRYQWCDTSSDVELTPGNIDASIGWSVAVKNREQTEYEALFDAIYGEPVTTMFYTYNMCYAMTSAPAVPKYITDMSFAYTNTSISVAPILPETVTSLGYAFAGTPITEAPILPSGLKSLFYTFSGCKNLKAAPEIPSGVVNMAGTFAYCSALVAAPIIPENVCGLSETFYQCSSLIGMVIINATEVEYLDRTCCFEGTEKPITLTGSASKEILLALAESSFNNNVTVDL